MGIKGNMLDLIFSSKPSFVRGVCTSANVSDTCDHFAVTFELHLWTAPQQEATKYRWKINREDQGKFQDLLEVPDWMFLENSNLSLDEMGVALESQVLWAARNCFQLQLIPVKNLAKLRLSREARTAISKHDSLFKHAKESGCSAALKTFRAAARRASGLVKRDHWNLVDEIASGRRE